MSEDVVKITKTSDTFRVWIKREVGLNPREKEWVVKDLQLWLNEWKEDHNEGREEG